MRKCWLLFFAKCFQKVLSGYGLTSDKILVLTKLKAFADDKFYVSKIIISVFDRVENVVDT